MYYEIWIGDDLHGVAHMDVESIVNLQIDQEGNAVFVLDPMDGKHYCLRWMQFYQVIDFSSFRPSETVVLHNETDREFVLKPGNLILPPAGKIKFF